MIQIHFRLQNQSFRVRIRILKTKYFGSEQIRNIGQQGTNLGRTCPPWAELVQNRSVLPPIMFSALSQVYTQLYSGRHSRLFKISRRQLETDQSQKKEHKISVLNYSKRCPGIFRGIKFLNKIYSILIHTCYGIRALVMHCTCASETQPRFVS